MKRKKLQLFCLLVFILSACSASINNDPSITRKDRADVIRLSLEHALVDQAIPDYGLIPDPTNIVLSTANIDADLAPTLPGINLILLTQDEIQDRANREGDFLYIEFTDVTVESDTRVTVSLSNTWAVSDDSETAYLSGGGFVIEFTKIADGWIGEVRSVWMS
ncbi:MAG: hypothetical protein GY847_00125 [Proteobacteria bacterium]|nr:hypothetical protein [Pseudomonadota bacterium]